MEKCHLQDACADFSWSAQAHCTMCSTATISGIAPPKLLEVVWFGGYRTLHLECHVVSKLALHPRTLGNNACTSSTVMLTPLAGRGIWIVLRSSTTDAAIVCSGSMPELDADADVLAVGVSFSFVFCLSFLLVSSSPFSFSASGSCIAFDLYVFYFNLPCMCFQPRHNLRVSRRRDVYSVQGFKEGGTCDINVHVLLLAGLESVCHKLCVILVLQYSLYHRLRFSKSLLQDCIDLCICH